MKYLIVYREIGHWVGCIRSRPARPRRGGKTLDEVKDLIREAVEFHLEGMRQHGDPIPAPSGP